jgi:hypothetical protein
VWIVAFTFCLDGRITKSPNRGAQAFDGFVPAAEGFRQSMFQGFALGVVLWAGGGIAMFPASKRTERSRCKTFQARNRLCFGASNSSSRSRIAFGVIDMR